MSALIAARGVSARYGDDGPLIVRDVDLEIRRGDAVGLVGESGSGKTTLARLLVGALTPCGGELTVGDRPWSEISRKDSQRRRVQMVFQDPYGALNPRLTARAAVAEAIRHWNGGSRADANARAVELLSETGLARDAIDRLPGQLSGGQCQRIGIARALACDPDVLVADEPTSALDVSVQAQILNLLLRLKQTRELALVLISHDLAVVRYATSEALVMYGGQIVERGPSAQLLAAPAHPYTRILVDSIPGAEGDAEPVANAVGEDAVCPFAASCPRMEQDCLEPGPELVERDGRLVRCLHPLTAQTANERVTT